MNERIKKEENIPFKYLEYLGVSRNQVENMIIDHIQKIEGRGARIVNAGDGFAVYRYSDFDSKILGLKTGKVDYFFPDHADSSLLAQELSRSFKEDGLEYVTVRLSGQDLNKIHSLEECGFKLVDGFLILLRGVEDLKLDNLTSIEVREATEKDVPLLQERVAPTFLSSRFFKDPLISKKSAVLMHQKWIENSISKQVAEHVLVACIENNPVGFITLEVDRDIEEFCGIKMGHIPLIGTDPKYRGRHLGLQLTKAALEGWFKDQKVDYVRIETQLNNIPATRTYEAAGFRLVDNAVTLRWSSS